LSESKTVFEVLKPDCQSWLNNVSLKSDIRTDNILSDDKYCFIIDMAVSDLLFWFHAGFGEW
jgi:hypothetical protein